MRRLHIVGPDWLAAARRQPKFFLTCPTCTCMVNRQHKGKQVKQPYEQTKIIQQRQLANRLYRCSCYPVRGWTKFNGTPSPSGSPWYILTNRNRNRKLQISKAPLKSQAQGISLFTSAASNQRGFPIVRRRLRSGCQRVRECVKSEG